ncbi:MAG: NADH-quinone oxidoreductase subunit NuoK [Acidobacteria bacterium]|nr:NADH-quinone oxidoreductase subunit NuoK [Acidobacteriota bacterium]
MNITPYLLLAGFLFSIGLIGVLTRRSIILVFLSAELMLNSCNIVFLSFARVLQNYEGAIMVLFILALSAAEAAVGTAIVVSFIRKTGTSEIDSANLMRW